MARAGILYSHVAKAAAQLATTGKNPTVDNVRDAMGGTGSKSTIAPMLKQWKAEHQSAVTATEAGLPADLLEAVKGVYERVQAEAGRQVEMARAEHQEALQAVTEQLRQCQAREDILSQSEATLSADLAQTKGALACLQAEHQSAMITVATLQSDNTGLQQRLADRAAEVKALAEQLAHARGQFEHFQEAIATQRSEERQAFEQRIGRLDQDLAGAQQRLLAQLATVVQQDAQLGQLRTESADCRDEARAARNELAAVQADRVQLTRQLGEALASAQALADTLEASRQETIEVRMALAAQERQTDMLAGQFAGVCAERDQVVQEKLVLIQDNAALRERTHAGTRPYQAGAGESDAKSDS